MGAGFERPPTLDDIAEAAHHVAQSLPPAIRNHLEHVHIRVEEFCDEDCEDELDLETPFDLLGLYRGVSLDRKSISDAPQDVDMIFLYRRPILDFWCETGEELNRIIRHVLIHEVGHHLGLSDDDMEHIEAES